MRSEDGGAALTSSSSSSASPACGCGGALQRGRAQAPRGAPPLPRTHPRSSPGHKVGGQLPHCRADAPEKGRPRDLRGDGGEAHAGSGGGGGGRPRAGGVARGEGRREASDVPRRRPREVLLDRGGEARRVVRKGGVRCRMGAAGLRGTPAPAQAGALAHRREGCAGRERGRRCAARCRGQSKRGLPG